MAETLGLGCDALEETLREAARLGQNPLKRLAEVHKADPELAGQALAAALGIPYAAAIALTEADAERLRALPFAYLKRNLAAPFGEPGARRLAMADPFCPELADDVRRLLGAADLARKARRQATPRLDGNRPSGYRLGFPSRRAPLSSLDTT